MGIDETLQRISLQQQFEGNMIMGALRPYESVSQSIKPKPLPSRTQYVN
jgi:hypothetical protein